MTSYPDGRPESEQPHWRRDFPIDWPQDQYVSRRDLLKFLVVVSGGFSIGQLWIGWKSANRSVAPYPQMLLPGANALKVGETLPFTYPGSGDRCLLVRMAPDKLVAYSQKCTHLSCAVVPEPQHNRFHCPCHAGYFDMETGRPIAGPPRRPLPRIELEHKGGEVYAVGVILGEEA